MILDFIKKRDGKNVEFKAEKIKDAVAKAAEAVEQENEEIAEEITAEVLSYLKIFFKDGGTLEVEQIQDLVEKILIEKGYAEIAKAYILYREQHSKLRDSKKLFADAVNIMDDYLDRSDWKVNENSNMSYSLQGLNNFIASEVTGQYWLQEIYTDQIAELHSSGDLHIHDLGNLSVYCCGWDLEDLLRTGFRGVPTKIESAPPKHLKTALGQIVNFMYTLQGECYSSDTEILTKEGWKYFYELNKRDKVCTLNPETDKIEYQKPLRYIEKDYEGKMLHFSQRSLDMKVTPDHKLLVEQYAPHKKNNYYKKFVLAKNFNSNSNFIPKQGKWKAEIKEYFVLPPLKTEVYHCFGDNYVEKILEVPKIKMNSWLAFFGFWIAEGSVHERKRKMKDRSDYSEYIITITQNENENAADLKKLLIKLPFEFYISRTTRVNGPDKLNFRINSKQLYNYLKKFGHSGDKYIPKEIKNLDKSQLEILFKWMMKGDGYIGNGNYEYYTKSKKLADDVQEIMTKLGYCANIYIKEKDEFKWYVISRLATKMHKIAAKNINEIEYEGKVYCVEVPNQTLLVRRNGKSVWGGNCAGAQAFSNFDTYLAPFIAYDGLDYEEVKQAMQEFLFNMNVPTRVGFQSPFTNITMDLEVPDHLKEQAVIIGGEYQQKCYGEFQEEMDMFNRAFAELMMEGDSKGKMFSFPIPTYNITEDFEWENEKLNPVWEMTAKFGIPYFCLSENTFIITDKGSKQLKNININKDKVLGDDGSFYSITNLFKNNHKEYIKIITEKQQKIESSKNHKFPTDNGLKKAEDLSLNDKLQEYGKQIVFENGFILSYENHHLFDIIDKSGKKTRFEKINKNEIDDFYCLRIRNRERKRINKFNYEPNRFQTTLKDIRIPQKLDKDIFEMVGQLLGDGYLSKTKNSIRLTSNDSEIIDFFVRTINDKFDLDSSISKAGSSKNCLDVTVNSKILKEFLKHIGLKFGRGDEKEIPQIIYKRNDEEIGALLRGLFDTDGSISINNSGNPIITLTLKNRKLLQQVLELLMFLGIAAYYKSSRKKYGEIRIHGEKNIKLFKDKIGFSITRKACRLIAKDSNKPNLGDKIITKKQSLKEFGKDFRQYKEKDIFRVKKDTDGIYLFVNKIKEKNNYVEIKSLTNIKKEISTVDIHVNSKNHLFTLKNNVVVHNSNFINSDMDPEDARSMCCRLRLSNKELRKRGGGLFGANPMTGSTGVVTLNMPRIGYQAQNKEEFMEKIYYLMDQAKESLEIKRKVLETLTEQGLYPYAKFYLRDIKKRFNQYWKNHFNTIGLNGMNEALLNFMDKDIATSAGQQFAEEVMEKMRERLQQYQEETDNLYNLEATPAEGTAYRFARLDRKKFGDQITAANQERVLKEDADPYYTNSTQLPVGLTDDIFTALELQDELQALYTGGTVFHGFLGEKLDSIKATKKLVKRIAENFKLPYYTLTPSFSICPVHGYLPGEHQYCPKCEAESEAKEAAAESEGN